MGKHEFKYSYKIKLRNMASLSVYRTGYEQEHRGQVRGPETRDFYYLTLVKAGRGIYAVNGRRYKLQSGSTYLIYPHTTIQLWADALDPWKLCWVGFDGTDARLLLDAAGFSPETPFISPSPPEKMYRLMMEIYKHRGQSLHELIAMTARLYTVLSFLMKNAALARNLPPEGPGLVHIRRACDYIANHYREPVTVEEIAAHAALSRSQLYRVFMRHVSISPHQYLTEFRMREACGLMQKKPDSIKEVAFAVGIENPLYFSACFKRFAGQTPTEYLKSNSGHRE
jgi:AraC-like DNA-binding protein